MTKHWYIPTLIEDTREGGAFWTNACLADVSPTNRTETPKNITCKKCKAIFAHPHTPQIMAAKLWSQITSEQDKNEFVIEVRCNACPNDVDVSDFRYGETLHSMEKILHLLEHCAFEHMGGAEVSFVRVETFASAYELNYSQRKAAMTEHEASWRDRMELDAVR